VRDGLARPARITRDGGRPERTTYEITADGRDELRRWVAGRLPVPAREFPELPVALALLAVLAPSQARDLLAERVSAQESRLAAIEGQAPPGLPRLFLIEDEYRAALLRAEISWLRGLVDDLTEGRLTWDRALIEETLERFQ
jgi:DNA-binding PadR family transcriptional regulator